METVLTAAEMATQKSLLKPIKTVKKSFLQFLAITIKASWYVLSKWDQLDYKNSAEEEFRISCDAAKDAIAKTLAREAPEGSQQQLTVLGKGLNFSCECYFVQDIPTN